MATQNLRLIESSRGLSRIITQSGLGTDLQSVDRRGSGSFAVPARVFRHVDAPADLQFPVVRFLR